MKIAHFMTSTVLAAALLAGCGGGSQPQSQGIGSLTPQAVTPQSVAMRADDPLATPLPRMPVGPRPVGWLSPDATIGKRIYISDQSDSKIVIYSWPDGKKLGQITDGVSVPYGLFIDSAGTLYVVNSGNSTVTAYPLGSKTPSTTWSTDLARPLYAVVDASGDLFVGNANNGTVVEYPSGSTTPSEVIQTPGIEADGMDFDSAGNLYVAYRKNDASGGASIEEYAPGSTSGTSLGMRIQEPQGLIIDEHGHINVVETGSAQRIAHFLVGKTKPSVLLTDSTTDQFLSQLAYDPSKNNLYIAAYLLSPSTAEVLTLSEPFIPSSTLTTSISDQGFFSLGIALSFGQKF